MFSTLPFAVLLVNSYGATIRYLRWGMVCLPGHFFLFHKGDGKSYFFHLRIGCISTMPAL